MRVRLCSDARQAGMGLVETMIYVSIFAVILAMSVAALIVAWENHSDLSRNADDIVKTMRAGEQWRADIRSAAGPVVLSHEGQGQSLRVPMQGGGETIWRFVDGRMMRVTGKGRDVMLERIRTSRMERDRREHVRAWRWEVELASVQEVARVRPLFTFLAVE